MKALQSVKILFIISILSACRGQVHDNKIYNNTLTDTGYVDPTVVEVADSNSYSNYVEPEYKLSIETRLRFQEFSLVIHNFKGYETQGEIGSRTYSGQFGGGTHLNEAHLNDEEANDTAYFEALIVMKDTIHISESLGGNDDRINKTLLQILPNDKNDNFRISYGYLTNLYEMFDDRKLNEDERNKNYEKRFSRKEKSEFIDLKDSSNFYFSLMLLTDHNDQAWHINGAMSKSFYQEDLKRIKNKYNLKDTLIMFSGEGGSYYATLRKENRIFGYDTESYIIRIERFVNNKLTDTKYVVVYIAYGC